MNKLSLNVTDEMYLVLEKLIEYASDPDWLGRFPYLSDPQTGRLIEQLLRSHPAVDLVREELGIEWTDRPSAGRPWHKKVVKKSRKKVTS